MVESTKYYDVPRHVPTNKKRANQASLTRCVNRRMAHAMYEQLHRKAIEDQIRNCLLSLYRRQLKEETSQRDEKPVVNIEKIKIEASGSGGDDQRKPKDRRLLLRRPLPPGVKCPNLDSEKMDKLREKVYTTIGDTENGRKYTGAQIACFHLALYQINRDWTETTDDELFCL